MPVLITFDIDFKTNFSILIDHFVYESFSSLFLPIFQ